MSDPTPPPPLVDVVKANEDEKTESLSIYNTRYCQNCSGWEPLAEGGFCVTLRRLTNDQDTCKHYRALQVDPVLDVRKRKEPQAPDTAFRNRVSVTIYNKHWKMLVRLRERNPAFNLSAEVQQLIESKYHLYQPPQ